MTNYLKKRGLKLLHFAYVAYGCSMFQIRKLKCERNTGFTKNVLNGGYIKDLVFLVTRKQVSPDWY